MKKASKRVLPQLAVRKTDLTVGKSVISDKVDENIVVVSVSEEERMSDEGHECQGLHG